MHPAYLILIPKCLGKISSEQAEGVFSSPCMTHTDVVPHSTPDVSSTTQVVDLNPTGEAFESSIGQSPQHGKQIKAAGLSCARQHYESQGLSKNVASVLLNSSRPSTQKQYAVYLKN